MNPQQIAVQLYTLRDHCRTPDALARTCARVAEIGYGAVQVSAIDRTIIPERQIAAICRDHGLRICATHESGEEILQNPDRVVERLREMGCSITAYPMPRGIDLGSSSSVNGWIRDLANAAEELAAAGMTLAYHNHHMEFRRLDGRLLLERIFEETSLQAELDTYWVQYGGGDPVSWCQRLRGRLPLLHVKDYRINAGDQIEPAEVGAGNLDFVSIIAAADAAGCGWYIVEQDVCPGAPFDSIAESYRYLRKLC